MEKTRLTRTAAVVLSLCVAGACGRESTAPELVPTASSASIVVSDGAGGSFEFNPTTGIVSDGTGARISLTPEDAAALLTAYGNTVVVDSAFATWDAYTPPDDGPCDPSGVNGPPCDAFRASLPVPQIRGGIPNRKEIRIEPVLDAHGRRIRRSRHLSSNLVSRMPGSGPLPSFVDGLQGYSCRDVAQVVRSLRVSAGGEANGYVGVLAGALRGVFGSLLQGSPTPFRSLPSAVAQIEAKYALNKNLRYQMEILNGFGYAMECWNTGMHYVSSGYAGGYQPTGSSAPLGHYVVDCFEEYWRWSKDGGVTWQGKWIEVCEVTYAHS